MYSSTSIDDQKFGAPPPQLDAASTPPPYGGSDQKHGTSTPPTPPYGIPVSGISVNFPKPPPQIPQPQAPATRTSDPEGPWSTGLFDCFSDVPSCCITFCCPCITFGQVAEIVDKGSIFMRLVSGVPRTSKPRIRHVSWLAWECGETKS